MHIEDFYNMTGGNYADVLRRLHDEARIQKFLAKFADDSSFYQLECAIEQGDYETAFRAAHSLKGICMNLGLIRLQESSSALTENLRVGIADDQTALLYEKTVMNYNETCAVLRELLNSL